MDGQPVGAVAVSCELLNDILRGSAVGQWFRVEKGIPDDAEYVRCYADFERNQCVFVYRHPSFPLTRPGEHIRMLDGPQLSSIHLDPLPTDYGWLEALVKQQRERAEASARKEAASAVVVAPT